MSTTTIYKAILTKYGQSHAEMRTAVNRANDWFRNKALGIQRTNPQKMIKTAGPFKRIEAITGNSTGKMYLFKYDAKLKDKLPFWDMYPLIFPIAVDGDGFLGINLHYLPPTLRASLMDALYDTINNTKYDKTTKLRISYNILNGASRYRLFKPCVKRYLWSHVRSPFLYIAPDEWDVALMLPMARWQKASADVVYANSLSKVRS